jgi:small-conductance mechanosensitive channel
MAMSCEENLNKREKIDMPYPVSMVHIPQTEDTQKNSQSSARHGSFRGKKVR